MSFEDGEKAAEDEIESNGFDLELWNDFLYNSADFKNYSVKI